MGIAALSARSAFSDDTVFRFILRYHPDVGRHGTRRRVGLRADYQRTDLDEAAAAQDRLALRNSAYENLVADPGFLRWNGWFWGLLDVPAPSPHFHGDLSALP